MEIRIPEVGESVFEAEITTWHHEDGAQIGEGELLCELETDKISLELNAEASGTLRIKVPQGESARIGSLIGLIEQSDEQALQEEQAHKPVPEPDAAETAEKVVQATLKPEPSQGKKAPVPPKPQEQRSYPSPEKFEAEDSRDRRSTRKPMSPIRKRIARRMLEASQNTAMLTTFNEADMTRIQQLRALHGQAFLKKHGVKLGFMSLFVKACTEALKEFPEVNARIEGDDLLYHHYYDIGIAVGAKRGLVVPVLRDADRLHFAQIEQSIADFARRIGENNIGIHELQGGTFSISNGGLYGSLLSTPIVNYPQSAILGMHLIQDRPVVEDGQIVIRPMMNLALSYDHRIIDGRQAVSFLRRIRDYVQEPDELLLEM